MSTIKRYAVVRQKACVACGSCADVCPRGAISVQHDCFAQVDVMRCVGCGLCARAWCTFCPMGTLTQGICKFRNRKG